MDTTKTAMSSSEMVETTQKHPYPLYDKWVLWTIVLIGRQEL